MSRISASGIAGLFYGLSPSTKNPKPKKKDPMPTEGLLVEKIFPHGHVQEHNAITEIKKHVESVRGQDGFARDREHLDALCRKLLKKEDIVQQLNSAWVNHRTIEYAKQVGRDGDLAREEMAIAQRCIQQIHGELDYLQVPRDIKLEAEKHLASGYILSNGITYDVGRSHYKIGNLNLVCQPDGMCTYHGKKMVVEIKSCWGPLYTSLASRSSSNKPISNNSNIKKWLYYLIQIAIEMFPEDIEGVIFACFRGKKASMGRAHVNERKALNVIVIERKQMQGLINSVRDLLQTLEPVGNSQNSIDPFILWDALEDKSTAETAYKAVVDELRGPLLNSIRPNPDVDAWKQWYLEEEQQPPDEYPTHTIFAVLNNVYRFNKEYVFEHRMKVILKCEDNEHDAFAIKAYHGDEPIGWVASEKYIVQNMRNIFPRVALHSNDAVVDLISRIITCECVDHNHGRVLICINFRSFIKNPVRL